MSDAHWRAELTLRYRRDGARTVGVDRHHGPLRVLQPLYPEGDGVCHHVVVHPPGGVVGGDELAIDVELAAASHALITTPGATRFYRSEGALALQRARLVVAADARLEWLPMETIAYSGCNAESRVVAALAPGAEMIGWDLLVLGLPAAAQPFAAGCFVQHLEIAGAWLERARIGAADSALRESAAGWAGQGLLATLWFAAGTPLPPARRDTLLEVARNRVGADALAARAGVSAVQPGVVVLRALAGGVEPAMSLLAGVRAAWRRAAWGLDEQPPRIWRT